ncbi:MAG: large subunit ribosomal protein [Chloroflexota bacterium]|jgi:large subunit ribosomal protein L3|nr:large subunit ribosomal protein [Chloroflexota bacterium]
MSIGVIGKKVGMTAVFAEDGTMVPVSVVAVEPNTVTGLRTTERDGYVAVQLGAHKPRRLTKPRAGQLKGLTPVKDVREFRLDDASDYQLGQTLDVSLFEAGETVDVTGVSKGRGFSGTIKRHNFRRGPETHGSDSHRQPGSIGAGTYPGKVFKGTPMAGRMGNDTITVKKATVVKSDAERNVLLIKGPLPGARNALIVIRKVTKAVKKAK